MISQTDIDSFRRDGVVAIRDAFSSDWIERLREGIAKDMAAPSPNLVNHSSDPAAPGYFEDFWCWEQFEEFRDFTHQSPCGALAASLLGTDRVNLVMDNWFLREAGSTSRAPFHQDLAYFDFEGTMCVLWLPLEPVSKENGIAFVRGSHLWDKLFMRVFFRDGHSAAEAPVEINGRTYHLPPDVNADPEAFDIAQFNLDLGDCIFFDMRTLHGALAATIPTETVTRYTLRMTAPNGMIRYRGDWAKGERAMFEARGYRDGDRLAGSMFPQLWPQPA
ncbi:MAG: phytanoyl-CoA dioxygenase family protein [Pseudomonadota bacterium]